jgi:hypothetical protein
MIWCESGAMGYSRRGKERMRAGTGGKLDSPWLAAENTLVSRGGGEPIGWHKVGRREAALSRFYDTVTLGTTAPLAVGGRAMKQTGAFSGRARAKRSRLDVCSGKRLGTGNGSGKSGDASEEDVRNRANAVPWFAS